MKITSVRCEGYKPFHGPTELSFAPLTLVFGHNTSGKSALARLPRLALHAMAGSLDLSIGSTRYGESFLDLVHGRDMLRAMRLGLTLERADRARGNRCAAILPGSDQAATSMAATTVTA